MTNVTIFTLDRAAEQISNNLHEILKGNEGGFSAIGMKHYQEMGLYMEEIDSLYLAVDLNGNVDLDEVARRSQYLQDLLTTIGTEQETV